MNSIKRILSILILVGTATAYIACGGGDDPKPPVVEPTPQEKALALITAGTWTPTSVVVGSTDVTSEYFTGFTISFNANKTLTTTGTTPVWQRQDTWDFKNEGATVITRGQAKGKDVTIVELTETKLVLSLDWPETTTAAARSKSIQGAHIFTFNK